MNDVAPAYTKYNDFANENMGGRVLFATDDFFAICDNLISENDPISTSNYTEFGKWMDGWETRRKRIPGHDWCILKLATTCFIQGFLLDTAYFTGNYAPKYSIQGIQLSSDKEQLFPPRYPRLGSASSRKDLSRVELVGSEHWPTLVSRTELRPGNEGTRFNYHDAINSSAVSHVRLNIYPDGGLARLRVYGKASCRKPPASRKYNLMSVLCGAICEGFSNAQFGHPRNIIKPNKGKSMADGWETARRLDRPPIIKVSSNGTLNIPGEEWAVFRLAFRGVVETIVVDTSYFKGNYPDNIKVEGASLTSDWSPDQSDISWKTILPVTKLSPDKEQTFSSEKLMLPVTHLKVTIAPDGGFSRIRAFGYVAT